MSEKEVGETQRNDAAAFQVEKSSVSAAWAQTNWKIKLHGYRGAGRGQVGIREPRLSICLKTWEIHDQKVISSSSLMFILSWCSALLLAAVALHQWHRSVLSKENAKGLTNPCSVLVSQVKDSNFRVLQRPQTQRFVVAATVICSCCF